MSFLGTWSPCQCKDLLHNKEDEKVNKDLTLSSDADAVGVAIGTRRPIMHHSVHGNHLGRFL